MATSVAEGLLREFCIGHTAEGPWGPYRSCRESAMDAATGNTEKPKSVLRNERENGYFEINVSLFKVVCIGLFAPYLLTNSDMAVAATAPNLGSTSSFGVVSSTFTNTDAA